MYKGGHGSLICGVRDLEASWKMTVIQEPTDEINEIPPLPVTQQSEEYKLTVRIILFGAKSKDKIR